MLPRDYRDSAGVASTVRTGHFVDFRGVEVNVVVLPSLKVHQLAALGRQSVKDVATEWRRVLTQRRPNAVSYKWNSYQKKMNLNDDPSEWSAWQVAFKFPSTWKALSLRRTCDAWRRLVPWVSEQMAMKDEETNTCSVVLRRLCKPRV